MRLIKLTADDEFPDCGKCHNSKCSTGEFCGPEYGWAGYYRVIDLDNNYEDYFDEEELIT